MRTIHRLILLCLLGFGSAFAQSTLPACPTNNYLHNCFGTYTFANWGKYIGEFKEFLRNGQGTLTLADGNKYVGEFKGNKLNGQGTYTYVNGNKYVGEFKDDKRNGLGTFTLADGRKYVGEFKDDKQNGQGTFTSPDGEKYVGEFKDDNYNGEGTLYASNGSIVNQGIWADNNFVRSAPIQQATIPNSAFSMGNLSACQGSDVSKWSNCFGTVTYANGTKYVGEFKDGKSNGQGTFTYASGDKYVGELKDDKSNGQGTYTYANGAKYVGEFKDGKSNGLGTFTLADGRKYVGEFKDNKYNGQGYLYASNGSIVNQGIFADNNFVRSAPVQQATTPNADLERLRAEAEEAKRKQAEAKLNLAAEAQEELKKRQELEQQLASFKERERITTELDFERKKRQELEAQLAASVQPTPPLTNAPRRIAHALVIGNGAYPGSGRLDNPVNDANAISQKLRSMGFTVTTVTDANRQRLVQSMAQFRRSAASADISLLYYAGHGVQIFGTNYILPTDVDQTDPAQATIQGVSLNSVVENFLPGKTKLVFLDACRDNALQRTNDRSVSKGLAPISAAEGTLISYATKDGQTASDGMGSKNSPFTQALLEHLNDPQDIAVVLRKVRERVMKITGGKQQPWEYGSLTGGELVLSAIKPK